MGTSRNIRKFNGQLSKPGEGEEQPTSGLLMALPNWELSVPAQPELWHKQQLPPTFYAPMAWKKQDVILYYILRSI